MGLQGSLLVRNAPPAVADAFCAARLAGGGGRSTARSPPASTPSQSSTGHCRHEHRGRPRGTRERLLSGGARADRAGRLRLRSVLAIADRAGVAAGTLYRHFLSKEELFLESSQGRLRREERAMRPRRRTRPARAPRSTGSRPCRHVAHRALQNRSAAWALLAEPVDPRWTPSGWPTASAIAAGRRRANVPRSTLARSQAGRSLHRRGARRGCGEALVGPLRRSATKRPRRAGGGVAPDVCAARQSGPRERAWRPRRARRPVTTVLLSRPERRNAVDRATAEALTNAFREFDADPTPPWPCCTARVGCSARAPI